MSGSEYRVHARIQVSTSVEVRHTIAGERRSAVLKDLSKGGARLVTVAGLFKPEDELELFLPSLAGPDIVVRAAVIRSTPSTDGDSVACRFDDVPEQMRQSLLDLVDVLLSTSGAHARADMRVARRMDITFGDLEELCSILDDIPAGNLTMTVVSPLVLYEELDVTVPDSTGNPLLILQARVVNQRVIPSLDATSETLYRVGLQVAEMRTETKRCLSVVTETVRELLVTQQKTSGT